MESFHFLGMHVYKLTLRIFIIFIKNMYVSIPKYSSLQICSQKVFKFIYGNSKATFNFVLNLKDLHTDPKRRRQN